MGEVLSIKSILGQEEPEHMNDSMSEVDDDSRPPERCPHCGKALKYKKFAIGHFTFGSHLEKCDCPGAEAEREREMREKERLQQEEEARKRMKRIEELFRQSRLGLRFREKTFENYKIMPHNKKAFQTTLEYARNFAKYKEKGEGIFITGDYGTGKTHLAAAITNYLLGKYTPVIMGNVTKLLGNIKQVYDDSQYTEAEILKELYTVDLLVIDDLGKEKPTAWVEEKLYTVINERYENYRPIVVTSNLELEEIEQRLENCGGAIVSRIIEMCQGIKIKGPDFRKQKLEKGRDV